VQQYSMQHIRCNHATRTHTRNHLNQCATKQRSADTVHHAMAACNNTIQSCDAMRCQAATTRRAARHTHTHTRKRIHTRTHIHAHTRTRTHTHKCAHAHRRAQSHCKLRPVGQRRNKQTNKPCPPATRGRSRRQSRRRRAPARARRPAQRPHPRRIRVTSALQPCCVCVEPRCNLVATASQQRLTRAQRSVGPNAVSVATRRCNGLALLRRPDETCW
jgi:hypothetical protein